MKDVQEIPDEEHEQVLSRVAAVDVAKASGMVCTRVPHPSTPGRRVSKVWQLAATTNAILALADELAELAFEDVTFAYNGDGEVPALRGVTIAIPAGNVTLGSDEFDYGSQENERPRRTIGVGAFEMDKYEVTNEQYQRFRPSHDNGSEPMLWLKWHPGHFVALNQPRQPVCRAR